MLAPFTMHIIITQSASMAKPTPKLSPGDAVFSSFVESPTLLLLKQARYLIGNPFNGR